MDSFYFTTTLPYVNASPHLGFAWEILVGDFICRFQRLQNHRVIFNTGTDEHGQKIYEQALAEQLDPQAYTNKMSLPFKELATLLNLQVDRFVRTSDDYHHRAATAMWERCLKAGDIYKKKYTTKYCVGCELEKTDSELIDGRCPLHPNQELQLHQEDNYFFRFSKYGKALLEHYQKHPDFVVGKGKMTEITAFVSSGLQDFSISRLKEKMPWGVDVPGDDTQVMYVWFDALTSYLSTLHWPDENGEWKKFWPVVQICGKDNLRQQAAMWQAMLLSAGLPFSKKILVNGFITVDGQKMSKSLGNVIVPRDLVKRYGRDGTRFLIAGFQVFGDDVDITQKRLDNDYTAYLVNGLGNLSSRLAKLSSNAELAGSQLITNWSLSPEIINAFTNWQTHLGLQRVKDDIDKLDKILSREKPWLIKDKNKQQQVLLPILQKFLQTIFNLQIYLPETATTLMTHFTAKKIKPLSPLFPRLRT